MANPKVIRIKGVSLEIHESGDIFRMAYTAPNGFTYPKIKLSQATMKSGHLISYARIGGGRRVGILVHRAIAKAFIPGFSDGLCVDHVDGNPSNNNKENLRIVTMQGNQMAHLSKQKGSTSKYRGVCFIHKKWQATISKSGKKYYLGLFNKEDEAAIAYNEKATELGFFPEALNKIA